MTSREVIDLEAKHSVAQEEVRNIKSRREEALQDVLAKRRELKELNVSVVVGAHSNQLHYWNTAQ